MFYRGKHVISIGDVSRDDFLKLFDEAERMETYLKDPEKMEVLKHVLHKSRCTPKKLYALIDKSTRTDVTFEDATENLGGKYSLKSVDASSISKGESARMTALVLAQMAVGIIIRHDKEPFFAQEMADAIEEYHLPVSVISAGCGDREHPTQTFVDLYPLYKLRRRDFLAGNLIYALGGDLSYSRTEHSFLIGLAALADAAERDPKKKVKVFLFGPPGEQLPDWLTRRLEGSNLELERATDILEIAPVVDVWYFTRWQKNLRNSGTEIDNEQEREYARQFGVTEQLRKRMHKHAIALHPLPHGLEYPHKLDLMDERFIHLRQVIWAVPIRMALLRFLFAPDHKVTRILEECIPKTPPINLTKVEIPASEIIGQCITCDNVIIAGYGRVARLVPGEKEKLSQVPSNQLCQDCRQRIYVTNLSKP